MSLGPLEIGLIVLAILLLFGAKRLPELGRGLGSGMREFKEGVTTSGKSSEELPPATPATPSVEEPAREADRGDAA